MSGEIEFRRPSGPVPEPWKAQGNWPEFNRRARALDRLYRWTPEGGIVITPATIARGVKSGVRRLLRRR